MKLSPYRRWLRRLRRSYGNCLQSRTASLGEVKFQRTADRLNNLRSIAVSLIVFFLLVLIVQAWRDKVATRDRFEIAAFTVPKELEDVGFKPAALTEELNDDFQSIIGNTFQNVTSPYRNSSFDKGAESSLNSPDFRNEFEDKEPEIEVPEAKFSLQSLFSLMGDKPPQIHTEIVKHNDQLVIILRETGREGLGVDNSPVQVTRTLKPYDNLTKAVREAVQEAALQFLKQQYPFYAAAYYEGKGQHGAALALLPACLKERDREMDKWTYNLWGLILYGQEQLEWNQDQRYDPQRLKDAEAKYKQALAADDTEGFPLPYDNLGLVADAQDDHRAAVIYYSKAVQRDPAFEVAISDLGYQLIFLGEYAKACEEFERAASLNPSDAYTEKHWGLALLRWGEHDKARHAAPEPRILWHEAEKHYEKALALDPQADSADAGLAELAADQAELAADQKRFRAADDLFRKAEGLFRTAIEIDPQWPDWRKRFADALRAHAQKTRITTPAGLALLCKALAQYQIAFEHDKRWTVGPDPNGNGEGRVGMTAKRAIAAIACQLQKIAAPRQPGTGKGHATPMQLKCALADAMSDLAADDQAIASCLTQQESIGGVSLDKSRRQDDEQALRKASKEFSWAATEYHEVLRLAPQAADLHPELGLARLLVRQKNFPKAIQYFQRAYDRAPSAADQEGWGEALEGEGNVLNALTHYECANTLSLTEDDKLTITKREQDILPLLAGRVALRPDDVPLLCCWGDCLRDLGNASEAQVKYKAAIKMDVRQPQAYNGLGLLAKDQGWDVQAVHWFRAAIQRRPNWPDAHEHLAEEYDAISDKDKALDDFSACASTKAQALHEFRTAALLDRSGFVGREARLHLKADQASSAQ